MHRLWSYLSRYRVRYMRGIACLVVSATLAMSMPLFLKWTIEAIQQGQPFNHISWYVLVMIAIACVQGIMRAYSRFMIFNIGRDVEYDLRNDLFAHLQKLSLSYYQRQAIGDL